MRHTRRSFLRMTAFGLATAALAPAADALAAACDCNEDHTLPPGGVPAPAPQRSGYNGPSNTGMAGCPVDDLYKLMDILGRDHSDAVNWLWLPNQKLADGSPDPRTARMFNGYRYSSTAGSSITLPKSWAGKIDWWDRFKAGTSGGDEPTPNVVEATVWLNPRCNP